MTRVAVIDDHMVVRAGLKYLLEAAGEMEFAGELAGGEGAADFVLSVKPDVTLLDVRMPDKNGIEALKDILAAEPGAKVVMLTTSDTEEDVFRAIEEGAMGYVIKDSPVEIIAAAIRSAVAGDVYMTDGNNTYCFTNINKFTKSKVNTITLSTDTYFCTTGKN